MAERMFPLQTTRSAPPGPLQIPWSVAEVAYGAYVRENGHGQSLERLAERGGFGWCEMDLYHPGWRAEVSELEQLRAEVARLRAQVAGFEHCQELWNKGMESTCAHLDRLKQEVRRLEAEVARLRPTWTKEVPTVPGWYWWRDSSGTADMLEVRQSQCNGVDGKLFIPVPYHGCTVIGRVPDYGEWAGPLSPPE